MAEAAVVEERPAVPTRYYCHMCNVEINIPNTDYTCPLCAGGFVEELPAATLHSSSSGGPSGSSSNTSSDTERRHINRLSELNALRGEIATLLMSRNGPNLEIQLTPDGMQPRRLSGPTTISLDGGNGGTSSGNGTGGNGTGNGSNISVNTGGGRVRPPHWDRLDNVLLDFLHSISGVDIETPYGNQEMFFLGNLGDYAWGREGIDTIVTQLLNQMETSGPPPLPKDKIAEIPKVEITDDDVERKLQCSVCWEDFRLKELVRKLPCSHVYHENCIVPWLDLHGTCPICRKSLTDECTDVEMGGNDAATHSIQAPIGVGGGGSGIAVATTSNATNSANISGGVTGSINVGNRNTSRQPAPPPPPQQQQQQQRNNVFGFDDGTEDLD